MPITPILHELLLDLLALLWPTECVGCGAADRECCASCLRALRAARPGHPPQLGTPCFARAEYAGVMRAVLVALKHGGRVRFARELGAQLSVPLHAARAQCGAARPPVIVPAPSRPASVRRRGFRHVELLVAAALRAQRRRGSPMPTVLRALRTTRGRRGQVGLGPAERARNAGLLGLRRTARAALRGREVILVDDVLTTGATVLAARDTLTAAGARVVAIVVLCVAERAPPPGN
ncbi:ComF family protein [Leucobacter luti]|uniref:Putative amidophosphoribosyltransferase n=1 Tax=Leucobacter luti TaxID=340320 RepID=A0A4Q7TZ75_9MICO|nr:phosphoribosyltransferase family protein [Leucobacter luti]MBL3698905.1 ComF family protein [Leucobacter luti]RZT66283.1 putative amidophosphoribosyltransferase [Leucobacter luti]